MFVRGVECCFRKPPHNLNKWVSSEISMIYSLALTREMVNAPPPPSVVDAISMRK